MSAGLVLQGGQSQAKGGGHWLSERKESGISGSRKSGPRLEECDLGPVQGTGEGADSQCGGRARPEDLETPRFILFLPLTCCMIWGKSHLLGFSVPVGES